jgi:phenylacetate-CoA ligase
MKPFRQVFNKNSYIGNALRLIFHYKIYKETYEFLSKSQWWNQNQLATYQLKQLEKMLNHAYMHVPYYRNIFYKKGLKPEDFRDLKDLQNLPFLTKEIAIENVNLIKAKNYPEYKFEYETTGGSTGTPFGFYVEYGTTVAINSAFYKIMLERGNCNIHNKMVFLTKGHRPLSYNLFCRFLELSCFFMTDYYMKIYLKRIRAFKPNYIFAYPPPITMLAKYMNQNNIKFFPSIKAIFCSGEILHNWQCELLEKTFKCRVFNIYGSMESAVLGCSCKTSNYFHIFPEYGIVELIDRDGKTITRDGEMGEIVATGFTNFIFPFIRYRTGDIGVYSTKKCECGRNYPLLKKIEGRLQDFIIAKDGTLIPSPGSIFATGHKEWIKFKQIQFFQEKPGELIIRAVKDSSYNEIEAEQFIIKLYNKIFNDQCKLYVEFVDQIPLAKSGKYQYLIQKLPIKFAP